MSGYDIIVDTSELTLKTSTFFRHGNMAPTQVTGDLYGKMKIDSIHKSGAKVWILGYWFYTQDQMKDLKLSAR